MVQEELENWRWKSLKIPTKNNSLWLLTKSLLCSLLAPLVQTRKHHCQWLTHCLFLPWGKSAAHHAFSRRFRLVQSDADLSSNGRVSLSPREPNWSQMPQKNMHWCTSAFLMESSSMNCSVSHVFMPCQSVWMITYFFLPTKLNRTMSQRVQWSSFPFVVVVCQDQLEKITTTLLFKGELSNISHQSLL